MPSAKRILLVDENSVPRHSLAEQLAREAAYQVVEACSAAEARAAQGYALAIIDAALEDGKGASLGRELRADGFTGPVLLLTEEAATEAGHLAKPFRLSALLSRISLHLGPHGAGEDRAIRIGPYLFQPGAKRLTGTRNIRLTEKETNILKFLHSAGRTVPLLDITLGLDDNSTGRQNIRLRGLFMGLPRQWVAEHEAEISAFSELGDYLDMPVRTYSSGMRMRLAFSIAMSVQADILLLDEVLGVGDSAFQAKAKARLREVAGRAGIVVLALHSSAAIMELCDKALWLQAGSVRMIGKCHDVVREYDNFMHHRLAA